MGHPLTSRPSAEHQLLLDEVGRIYLQFHRWPSWAYLEEFLERQGLNPAAVISSLPRETTYNYGYTWPPQTNLVPQSQVGLTIAGLRHVKQAAVLVADHCMLVGVLGAIRSEISLDPFANERPQITMAEVSRALFTTRGRPLAPIASGRLDFIAREPSTWHCQLVHVSDEDWTIELSPQVRRFAGIASVDEYLERLTFVLIPDANSDGAFELMSPFTLPASLDYLDTVWRLKFGAGLVVPPGVERSARLAFDVNSPEEADTALSALAEVLKSFQVSGAPGVGGHPLQRIGLFLEAHLTSEAGLQVSRAVEVLDAARQIRAGTEHFGAQARSVAAFATLGLTYPVMDWASAWRQIQQAVSRACDVIRLEVHAI